MSEIIERFELAMEVYDALEALAEFEGITLMQAAEELVEQVEIRGRMKELREECSQTATHEEKERIKALGAEIDCLNYQLPIGRVWRENEKKWDELEAKGEHLREAIEQEIREKNAVHAQ